MLLLSVRINIINKKWLYFFNVIVFPTSSDIHTHSSSPWVGGSYKGLSRKLEEEARRGEAGLEMRLLN